MDRTDANQQNRRNLRRPPLTKQQKVLMLAGLTRQVDAAVAVMDELLPERFDAADAVYAAVWSTARDHYRTFKKMPTRNIIRAEIEQRLAEDPDTLGEGGLDTVRGLLNNIYRPEKSSLQVEWTIATAKQYLEERLVDRAVSALDRNGRIPTDLGLLVADLARQSAGIQALTNVSASEPFPEDWQPKALLFKPTHVRFIDEMLNGGPAGNEVTGLVGPTKGGKTTLLNQICISAALQSHIKWVTAGRKGNPERAYFFSWEDCLDPDLRFRAIGYAASIARETLEKGSQFSTSKTLKPYEVEHYRSQLANGARVPGEKERIAAMRKRLNRVWAPFDMTGADPEGDSARGTGYISEVVRLVEADQKRFGSPGISVICIDYAGAMADRHINHNNLPEDRRRHLIGRLPYRCRTELAMRFQAPVFLGHQIASAENLKSSGHKQRSMNAAEAKSFPENCNHCFTMGTLTDDKLGLFCLDVSRRVKSQHHRILRLVGDLWLMKDVGSDYLLDSGTHRIVARSDMGMIGDTDPQPQDDVITRHDEIGDYHD